MPVIHADVAICGEPQSGKTTLLNQFCYEQSKQNKQILPTMYPELHVKRIKIPETQYQVEFLLIDCPSHKLTQNLAQRAIAECKYLLLVTNGQDANAMEQAKKWISFFRDATTQDHPKGVVAQNFSYEGREALNENQLAQKSGELGLAAVRCNASSAKDVDIPFMMLAQQVYNFTIKEKEGK